MAPYIADENCHCSKQKTLWKPWNNQAFAETVLTVSEDCCLTYAHIGISCSCVIKLSVLLPLPWSLAAWWFWSFSCDSLEKGVELDYHWVEFGDVRYHVQVI